MVGSRFFLYPRNPALLLWVLAGAPWCGARGESVPASAMRVLKANCLACHNAEKRKGGLALTSRETLLAGGDGGAAVVEGKPEDSPLIQSLATDGDPHMPPKKQLTPAQIALLSGWVRDGFAWDAEALAGPASGPRAVSLAALPAAYRPVMALALSPDGSRLAAGCGNEVLLFRTESSGGKTDAPGLALLARSQAHPDAVQSMAWLPDGRTLVTGAFRRAVVWNAENLTLRREVLLGLTDRISSTLALPAQPGQVALADGLAAESGIVRILDTGSGEILRSWTAHADTIYSMALSHDGKRLATAGGDKQVRLWNPDTGAETARLEAHSSQVLSVAFNPDDTQLITGGADRQLKVWDAVTRGNLISLPVKDSAFNALTWSLSGPAVFAAMDDGGLMKYTDFKAHTGAQSSESGQERRLGKVASTLYCLTVSADGGRIFAGSHDGQIFAWDKNGKLTDTIQATTAAIAAVAPAATVTAPAAPATPP